MPQVDNDANDERMSVYGVRWMRGALAITDMPPSIEPPPSAPPSPNWVADQSHHPVSVPSGSVSVNFQSGCPLTSTRPRRQRPTSYELMTSKYNVSAYWIDSPLFCMRISSWFVCMSVTDRSSNGSPAKNTGTRS